MVILAAYMHIILCYLHGSDWISVECNLGSNINFGMVKVVTVVELVIELF